MSLLLLACNQAPVETDTREPVAIQYVGGEKMAVHARPDDRSPVITRYQHSESVPVLARKGEWAEVRTATGSGWVHQSDLVGAEEAAQSKANPTARFMRPPSPVTSPGVHGTIYIEADVNTDGDVTSTKIITNTTGSADLAAKNAAALQRSKFYPIVIRGERKPFEYYYRVDY
jgi:outer membrane biosynthesis protein TonB